MECLFGASKKIVVDSRDTDAVKADPRGAIKGHINIPYNSLSLYESRMKNFNSIFPKKDSLILVYGETEKIAESFKNALETRCGYTNVHNCKTAEHISSQICDIEFTSEPNLISHFATHDEIRALYRSGAVLIDSRDAAEIAKEKDAFVNHVNIPWSTFSKFSAKLNAFGPDLLSPKDHPVMIHCMRGRRAQFFKEALEKQCNYTNVYNVEHPMRVHTALPELEQTSIPNIFSEHLNAEQIKSLGGAVSIFDAREPEEIGRLGDAVLGHINIPVSDFSQYCSRLSLFDNIISPKVDPVLVYCTNGRRASLLKDALQRRCGYKNVFTCSSPHDILTAFPGRESTDEPMPLSPYASPEELTYLVQRGALIVDVREPEEIDINNAFSGRINLPWGSCSDYLSKLSVFDDMLGAKSCLIIVHCTTGRRSGLFKDILEKHCGFTNVFNGQNFERIHAAATQAEGILKFSL